VSDSIALPAFEDNYIWIRKDSAGRAVVIDPGDAGPVLEACAQGLELVAILITHHHHDHTGGVPRLQAELDLTCYAPANVRVQGRSSVLHAGERVQPEGYGDGFEVLPTPGHTLDHLSFVCGDQLYCGDTLFSLGCGRLFEGTPSQMFESLQRLAALPSATKVYCAHEYTLANARFARTVEPDNAKLQALEARIVELRQQGLSSLPSRLQDELDCNPFLRCDQASVRAAVERHAGRRLNSEVDVFAALRAWKDGFRG
jgi:hydroxyacylglutathione hydrolase